MTRKPLSDRGAWSCALLVRRQLSVMLADPASLLLLFLQPVLISVLLALVSTQAPSIPKKLFLGSIAVLWLACSNGAQVVVRERAILARERLAGMGVIPYLLSKYFVVGISASVQVLLLFAGLSLLGNGLVGNPAWQLLAWIASAWVMSGIGICISSACTSTTQAAMAVPLVIIPQILFAGYVFPLEEWKTRPIAAAIGWATPSRATQQLIDLSLFWDRHLDPNELDELGLTSAYRDPPHWRNLKLSVVPATTWLGLEPKEFVISEEALRSIYAVEPGDPPLKPVRVKWPQTPNLPMGRTYFHPGASTYPLALLGGWFLVSFAAATALLKLQTGTRR